MEDPTNSLDDIENKLLNENKPSKKYIIIIIFLVIFIVLLIGGIVFMFFYFQYLIQKEKEDNKNEKSVEDYLLEINGFKEKWYDIYGNRTINISYLENDVIPNTYKKSGSNYIEELGEVNGGKDYSKHDVNVYDLYIPYSALKRKNKHNGVVYRILDEITACIKSIKKELISQNFEGDKLELALYGISAGGQLILTYALSNKDDVIPIKYIMNAVGIVSINSTYWYKPAIPKNTLDNIESVQDIEAAKQNKSLAPIDRQFVLGIINAMSGKMLTKEEVNNLIVNGEVNTSDEKYQQIYNFSKYGSPIEVIGKKFMPTLCLYGGNDDLVGVNHYSLLRQAYIDHGQEDKIELVYMKYGGHERFHHGTEHDIIAMKEMHAKMVEYGKKYFTWD